MDKLTADWVGGVVAEDSGVVVVETGGAVSEADVALQGF